MFTAASIGRFVGRVLAECGPVLVEIVVDVWRRIRTPEVEDAQRDIPLRERLMAKVNEAKEQK